MTVTAVFVLSSCFGEPAENDNAETKCNHVEVTDAAVQPTCTEDGKTEGKHCSLCGEIFAAQETVEKLGHDEAIFGYAAGICITGSTAENVNISNNTNNGDVTGTEYAVAAIAFSGTRAFLSAFRRSCSFHSVSRNTVRTLAP